MPVLRTFGASGYTKGAYGFGEMADAERQLNAITRAHDLAGKNAGIAISSRNRRIEMQLP